MTSHRAYRVESDSISNHQYAGGLSPNPAPIATPPLSSGLPGSNSRQNLTSEGVGAATESEASASAYDIRSVVSSQQQHSSVYHHQPYSQQQQQTFVLQPGGGATTTTASSGSGAIGASQIPGGAGGGSHHPNLHLGSTLVANMVQLKMQYQERKAARAALVAASAMLIPSLRLRTARLRWEAEAMPLTEEEKAGTSKNISPPSALNVSSSSKTTKVLGKAKKPTSGVQPSIRGGKGSSSSSSQGVQQRASEKKKSSGTSTVGNAIDPNAAGSLAAKPVPPEVLTIRKDLANEMNFSSFEAYSEVEAGGTSYDRWACLLSAFCVAFNVSAAKLLAPLPPTTATVGEAIGGLGGGSPPAAAVQQQQPQSPRSAAQLAPGVHLGAMGFHTTFGRRIRSLREEARHTVDSLLNSLHQDGGLGVAGGGENHHDLLSIKRDEYCLLEAGGSHEFEKWCIFIGNFSRFLKIMPCDLLVSSQASITASAGRAATSAFEEKKNDATAALGIAISEGNVE